MHSGSSGTLEAPSFDICEAIVIIYLLSESGCRIKYE
jgi:hypothetical protein